MRYRRVYVPQDLIQQWPFGNVRYVPMDKGEFERLVDAAGAGAGSPAASAAQAIASAEYSARLVRRRSGRRRGGARAARSAAGAGDGPAGAVRAGDRRGGLGERGRSAGPVGGGPRRPAAGAGRAFRPLAVEVVAPRAARCVGAVGIRPRPAGLSRDPPDAGPPEGDGPAGRSRHRAAADGGRRWMDAVADRVGWAQPPETPRGPGGRPGGEAEVGHGPADHHLRFRARRRQRVGAVVAGRLRRRRRGS